MYDIDILEIMATRYEIVFEKRIFFNLHNFTRIKDRNFKFDIIVEYTMVHIFRVPTRPGKPGKMRVHLENLEMSWNFVKFNKYHGKMTCNLEKLSGY